MEPKADSGATGAYTESHRVAQGEGGDGDSRAIKCSVLKSMVYGRFTVPKKNGSLRFIQDLQLVNKVTIRNSGVGIIVNEFAETFAGHAIYSIGDLYSGYEQFQLAMESRDITTMRTPIGLVRMCTLQQEATNSVAHMMNAMN